MTASGQDLLAAPPEHWAARLAYCQAGQFSEVQRTQRESWRGLAAALQAALHQAGGACWTVLLECDLLRLEKRIDAIILTDRAIFVIEYKHGACGFAPTDMAQAEDYALDLFDFHAASRAHPVIPLLLCSDAPDPANQWPILHGVTPVLKTNPRRLGALLRQIQAELPTPLQPLDAPAWRAAPYKPVPTIIDAARRLFDRHGVEAIASARAGAIDLSRTTEAVRDAIAAARDRGERRVVFVTGVPGAGKTLCGLNLAFGTESATGAAFLTGNAPLVAVLRGALEMDARKRQGRGPRQPRREARTVLQNVHRFLEHHVRHLAEAPAEHVVVFDEAQRAWDADQAGRDTQRRSSVLSLSEPGHMLEIMARVPGWSVIVALIGNGQEINTGEAGLAEWGAVIAASNGVWSASAAPRVLQGREAAQRLANGPVPWLSIHPALDLTLPIRSVHHAACAEWVDAVLTDRPEEARAIAVAGGLPFRLTRDLGQMRQALRSRARGLRRAGLVCSAKAKRLRAEGLGAQLHGADAEVVNWFLRHWPDVRASDALEVCATEYACQGLELDHVGLAWGGDFIRSAGEWQARRFAGTSWQTVHGADTQRHIRNTYRVLMTRARFDTILFVPPGHGEDATRPPAEADEVARYLLRCGVPALEAPLREAEDEAPALLL
ncbi:DNA/RNA helicase domain-containing protein [Pseudoroseomonas globiformis]|uniref:DNA/RNA helicase domain-containing protein n=1 Tax=Teichococcus globiformis TaxID=2307229 RepID=A0ABV7G669_9PROT